MMTPYQEFIYKSRYSRWLEAEGRREDWSETVNRYLDFMTGSYLRSELYDVIYNLDVMPSMRAMWTAGPALERCNVAGYNCSYLQVNNLRAFDELMYILMCGTGVGYSVERQVINELPTVASSFDKSSQEIVVGDSKAGWARAYRKLISILYSGGIPRWNMAYVRPAGSPLKTFGGRSSGPEPLEELFDFTTRAITGAMGRKLTSIEVHDLCCKVADIVVVGGVRRSAMISLSNLSDDRMRHAKSGQWWESTPYRALANNSAVYTERPDMGTFIREWVALYESKSGERGIFNRDASRLQASRSGRRAECDTFGTNPCSEIILRPNQFCNLSEVVVREYDTRGSISDKVRLATVLGTYQARLTNFKYLRKTWKTVTEDEALLGVSLTGIYDNPDLVFNPQYLTHWKSVAIKENESLAKKIGIKPSAAITCIKPSGTVSQLVDSASGCHPRYSDYYIRTVRGDNKDPLTSFLKEEGIPHEPAIGKEETTTVFSFYVKAPEGSVKRSDRTAVEHLKDWKFLQDYWCEHKPSCTINVKEDEWLDVGAWVYKNFDSISGVSFLPYDTGSYKQAPYQSITKEEYENNYVDLKLDWSKLDVYEDTTRGASTMACSGDVCELVDIG
jgi:ribonucleoside-diphosphate reductase alpha chain